jgi:hypothetical protein
MLPSVALDLLSWVNVLMPNWSRLVLIAGLGVGVAVALQYIGAHHASAANVALIFAACPSW